MKIKVLVALFVLSMCVYGFMFESENIPTDPPKDECTDCHQNESPGIYAQWEQSGHGSADVSCIDCHSAEQGESDAFDHYGKLIATLVTPKDCGQCHEQETEEVNNSYHAHAGEILDSNDAYLANVAGGLPASVLGCESCHGSNVRIDPDSPNKLARESWPNTGIGRINPDGSKGACTACHTRHLFSRAQARQPEACAKCHLGPDHPQKEIYDESKHGNTYYTNKEKMNLNSMEWVTGVDNMIAPTCATCHMSATKGMGVTHDVGNRIAWTLRPIVSVKKDNWEQKRENMGSVCTSCHGKSFADGHFYQYDGLVELYNEKFAKPAVEIMNLVRSNNLLENPASFSNKIEWTFWELWHHEGRRARHGAAMMGPDYTWWHGIYEVAQHFYFKLIPEAREFNNPAVNAYLDKLLKDDPMHQWLQRPTAELKAEINSGKIAEMYMRFYKKK
jgi:hypothetical protein